MGRVYLLDCTLRDGGYVNDWRFGKETIKGFIHKIAKTGIEMCEIGFLKDVVYDEDRAVFPDFDAVNAMIQPKDEALLYVGMIDMSDPLPKERIPVHNGSGLDIIRIIFKKDKLDDAIEYCRYVQQLGYRVSVYNEPIN